MFEAVTDVAELRRSLRERCGQELGSERTEDLVLAVTEAAANSLNHAHNPPPYGCGSSRVRSCATSQIRA